MELYSLFWNTAAIAGPVLLEKPLSSKVYRFYCAEDDRHARNYELELHKISLRSVCSLPCTSQYRTNGCMCFCDAAEISAQRSRILCCGPTYQHLVNFALGSLQSFASRYANVRIWAVVFYKKLVVIPPPDHPRRAAGRGWVWGLQCQLCWQPHPLHDLSLLRITDARRVKPVGELIG